MKPFTIEHLPVPPPSQQVAWCAGVVWQRRLRAVVMVGQPVAPSLARSHDLLIAMARTATPAAGGASEVSAR